MRRSPGTGAIPTMAYSHPRGPAFEIDAFRRSALIAAGARGECNLVLPQRPDFHLCILPVTGAIEHTVDFVEYECVPGTLLHVRPGQVHQWTPRDEMEAVCIIFGPAFLTEGTPMSRAPGASMRAEVDLRPLIVWPTLFTLPQQFMEPLTGVFDLALAHQEATTHATRSTSYLRHLIQAALALLADVVATAGPPLAGVTRELFERFALLLEARYATTRDVATYARALGVSPRTLTRACEAVRERTPKELIDERVAIEAKRLLAYSTLTIAEIAAHLHFSEPTNFVKFFRRTAGEAPKAFRSREQRAA